MKKAAKVEYGIAIVKPWSKEMYDHNDMVADAVRVLVTQRWENALNAFEEELSEEFMSDTEWVVLATKEMKAIQRAVTCHGFGYGYDVAEVARRVEAEIEDAPYYRLKDIAEDLGLELKKGFVGLK